LLSACSITSGYEKGPHGRPVYNIDSMTAGAAYKKADQLCPNGYDIISLQGQATAMDYIMTIECK
jgi:hypothetical protein